MKFKQVTLIDDCGITTPVLHKISELSRLPLLTYEGNPQSKEEIIERIGESDCILVSWKTQISAEVLQACPALKFIGLCASIYDEKLSNVAIDQARKLGIVVKGVRDYGNDGTAEFIFGQLIALFQGLGTYQWRNEPAELKGKSLGIIGMGKSGTMAGSMGVKLGMKVFYYNRSRKPEAESLGIGYLPLNKLLSNCDVISTHLPKNTVLLGRSEFIQKKKNSILVNTSSGLSFDKHAFLDWMAEDPDAYAIFDAGGTGKHQAEFSMLKNVISSDKLAGFTAEAKNRLSEKVLANLLAFL